MSFSKRVLMAMSRTRWWVFLLCLSVVLFFLDAITPPGVQVPNVFIVPTLLAAWFLGVVPGKAFAILLPLVRLPMALGVLGKPEVTPFIGSVNFGIRVTVFLLMVLLTHKIKTEHERIKTLEGILPICMHCKKICNTDGTWQQLESYISTHSEAMFSHGLCEACERKHYPEYPA